LDLIQRLFERNRQFLQDIGNAGQISSALGADFLAISLRVGGWGFNDGDPGVDALVIGLWCGGRELSFGALGADFLAISLWVDGWDVDGGDPGAEFVLIGLWFEGRERDVGALDSGIGSVDGFNAIGSGRSRAIRNGRFRLVGRGRSRAIRNGRLRLVRRDRLRIVRRGRFRVVGNGGFRVVGGGGFRAIAKGLGEILGVCWSSEGEGEEGGCNKKSGLHDVGVVFNE